MRGIKVTLTSGLRRSGFFFCYVSPNILVDILVEFQRKTDEMSKVRQVTKPAVVMGDFDAKSHLWGSPVEDRRGETCWRTDNLILLKVDIRVINYWEK